MDNFYIEYRDPIFGLIIFFFIIIVISISTYWLGIFKKRDKEHNINLFLENFNLKDSEDSINLLNNSNDLKLILTLAKCFYQNGEYDKSIAIYLKALENIKNQRDKVTILELLASIYLKVGFLERAKELFLNILKITPRNLEVLKKLLILYENLKDFDKAYELLEPLEELVSKLSDSEKIYLKKVEAFLNVNKILNSNLNIIQKSEKLFAVHSKKYKIDRLLIEFLIENNISNFYVNLDKIDLRMGIDLLWNLKKDKVKLNEIRKNQFLSELFSAKGFKLRDKSDIFEFSILIDLNSYKNSKVMVDLNFKYSCKICNEVYPIHFNRCPNCLSLFEFEVKLNLVEVK